MVKIADFINNFLRECVFNQKKPNKFKGCRHEVKNKITEDVKFNIAEQSKVTEEQSKVIEEDSKVTETFDCLICMESKPVFFIFPTNCSKHFCTDCISNYINAKLQDNIPMIPCPNVKCQELIEFDTCIGIISHELMKRWEDVLSRKMVSATVKVYCPYKNCSAGLLDPCVEGGSDNRRTCPHCKRNFCIKCQVPAWHDGMSCKEFQKFGKDSNKNKKLLKTLAKSKKWRKCPQCKVYVEKSEGCFHMVCRCKCQFCYSCGSLWPCGVKCRIGRQRAFRVIHRRP